MYRKYSFYYQLSISFHTAFENRGRSLKAQFDRKPIDYNESWIIWLLVGKLRNITFLAVNDKIFFLIACCYGVEYSIAVWIFGQNCCNQGVGACILRNECSISAKRNSSLEKVGTHTWWKSIIGTHKQRDKRYESFTQSKASRSWLDLWLWLLLVTMI